VEQEKGCLRRQPLLNIPKFEVNLGVLAVRYGPRAEGAFTDRALVLTARFWIAFVLTARF